MFSNLWTRLPKTLTSQTFARHFLLGLLFLLAAGSAFNGFYTKWGLRDLEPKFSLPLMLDGTADRPYVYRQLMPQTAKFIDHSLPKAREGSLARHFIEADPLHPGSTIMGFRKGDADKLEYAVDYYIIYMMCFTFYFIALFFMRLFILTSGYPDFIATLAPVIFSVCLPVLFSNGGMYYDIGEILFIFMALCCINRPLLWALVPISALATFNKESYLFFSITLLPLYLKNLKDGYGLLIFAGSMIVSIAINVVVKSHFAGNPGGVVEFHLIENLQFYLNPLNLLRKERTYGLPLFAGYSLVTLMAIAVLIWRGWGQMPQRLRLYVLTALGVTLPLLILFCAPGETRNLSFLYPAFVLLIAINLKHFATEGRQSLFRSD